MHMPGRAPGAGGGFHPEPATSANTVPEDTVNATATTGRRQAATVARATSTWHWVNEATGRERTRRAAARRIAKLTGTEPVRWDGEISDADWRTVLSAGADALLAQNADADGEFHLDLVDAAKQITAKAADTETTATVIERSTVLPVSGQHVAAAAANPDVTSAEEEYLQRWSPVRKDRSGQDPRGRYVIRCRDGIRRYPDGSLAD
ncbi:hypothetical protein [Kitasatospora sp. NPDC004272]